ncbi:hypothetical protein AQAU111925_13280 [Aquirufa aurantiipilula]
MICGVDNATANLDKLAGETTTLKRSPPLEAKAPCVATMVEVSARYSFMVAEATPLVNVMIVAVPKFTAVLFLSVTVGLTNGLVDDNAPENTMDLSPV